MGDYREDLRSLILADVPVSTLVGTRVAWGVAGHNWPAPYIVLNTVSDERPQHLKGYNAARVSRVQCDCFGSSHAVATDLADKVVAAVGTPAEIGDTRFGRVKAEGPVDRSEDVKGVGPVFRASMDLMAEHRPA